MDETNEKSGHYSNSAANRDSKTVIYCQSLVFDHPYLSCNDHCDWWLFQEIFFCSYFQKQLFFKTGAIRNLQYSQYSQCSQYSHYCNISTLSKKRLQVKITKFFEQLFLWNTSGGCFCQFDLLLIKNKICMMVSTKNVCRSGQSMLLTHY